MIEEYYSDGSYTGEDSIMSGESYEEYIEYQQNGQVIYEEPLNTTDPIMIQDISSTGHSYGVMHERTYPKIETV